MVLCIHAERLLGQVSEAEQHCSEQQEYVEGCFEYTISLLYEANTNCTIPKPEKSGFWRPKQTLRKPVGSCTKNVIGNTVLFECDEVKGKIIENVYHDVADGSVCQGVQCSCGSKTLFTLSLENGCNELKWGGVLMEWKDFCQTQ